MSGRLWAIGRPEYVTANAMLVCPLASGFGFADPVIIKRAKRAHMYQNVTGWYALSGQAMGSFVLLRLWRWSVTRDCKGPNKSTYMTNISGLCVRCLGRLWAVLCCHGCGAGWPPVLACRWRRQWKLRAAGT